MFGKVIVIIIVVAVAFWLLTRFRDSGRGGR
jgi:flagellar biogenesis protein FliO